MQIKEAGDAGEVGFLKDTLKEINDEANARLCCDCAFAKESEFVRQSSRCVAVPLNTAKRVSCHL